MSTPVDQLNVYRLDQIATAREWLIQLYENAGLLSEWEMIPEERKEAMSKKVLDMPAEDQAKLDDVSMIGHGMEFGHDAIAHAVMRNIKVNPEWIEGFIEAPSEKRPDAFKNIVVEASEQANKNSIDIGKAATYLAIGGTAGYFTAAGIAAVSMGSGGLALLTYGVTKSVVHYGSKKLFDYASDKAFEAMADKIDKWHVPESSRSIATVAMCASKILTLRYGENAIEALLKSSGIEGADKVETFSEVLHEAFRGQGVEIVDAEIKKLAKSLGSVDCKVFEKLLHGEKLESDDILNLNEAKELCKEAWSQRSDVVQALWSGTRRESKQRSDSMLMLHAVNGGLATVADTIKKQYIAAGISPADQDLRTVKMARLESRGPALQAAGLPRGETYLTLGMDDQAFVQYLDSGPLGRAKLLAQFPPDPGEARAAAMTPWEDLNIPKGGPLALKLATAVKAAQAYAAVKTLGGLAIQAAAEKLDAADRWAEKTVEKAEAWASSTINAMTTDAIHGAKAGLTTVADLATTGVGFLSKLEQRQRSNAAARPDPDMTEHAARKPGR